eukprot:m.176070 g.176070  ORF g.176070 m.176070 type:complete len:416 (+) comp21377_c0_seq1:149-1396(+)
MPVSFLLCALALAIFSAHAEKPSCSVKDFGAKGDDSTEDTAAIQAALNSCSLVTFPPGAYVMRPVQIPSHRIVDLGATDPLTGQPGVVLEAWRDMNTWPNSTFKVCSGSPYEDPHPHIYPQLESLLYANNGSNITLRGRGLLNGHGFPWWQAFERTRSEYLHNCRPKLIEFTNVTQLHLANFTLRDSPFWTSCGRNVRGVLIEGVRVNNTLCGMSPNTDGFNLAGEDVVIRNCFVRNGDDCVPLFPPTRNVSVSGLECTCGNGIVPVIWPDLSLPNRGGVVQDVVFANVTLRNTFTGIAIKSLPSFVGAAVNITFRDIHMDGVREAIMFNMLGQGASAAARPHGHALRTASVHGVVIDNVTGVHILQAGKMVCHAGDQLACTNITMTNVHLDTSTHYTCDNVSGSAHNCTPAPCF